MLRSQRTSVINSDTLISIGFVSFYLVIARNGDLSGRGTLSLLLYGGCFLIAFIGAFLRGTYVKPQKFIWFICLIPFLYTSPYLFDAVMFTVGIIFIVFLEYKTSALKKLYGAIGFVAFVNAVCIFIQSMDRRFFDGFAQTWYPEGMYQQYLRTINGPYLNGCNAIVGNTAGYLIYCIGLLYLAYLTHYYTKHKILNTILFIVCFLALILTGKRAIMICGMASMMIIYIISGKRLKKIQRFLFAALLATALLCSFTFLAELFPNANTIIRIADSIEGLMQGDDISSGRVLLYRYALIQFKFSPILGIGWKEFNHLTTSLYNYSSEHYVNNDYLQVLCETGIVGFVCIYLPMILFLIKTIRMYLSVVNLEINNESKMALVFSLFIQIFYLSYSVFEIPLYDRCFFFMYIVSVSIGYCAQNEIKGQHRQELIRYNMLCKLKRYKRDMVCSTLVE